MYMYMYKEICMAGSLLLTWCCCTAGDEFSLPVLDTGAWFSLAKHVTPLINATFPQRKTVFRVAT